MGALFTILRYSIGSMFVGVLLTLIGVALMFFLVGSWKKNSTFTPLSLIAGAVLFVMLAFQSVLMCGAITIKSYGDDVEVYINNLVAGVPEQTAFTQQDSQRILENIVDEYPLVGYFIGGADFRGHTPLDIAEAMVDELQSWANWYILRRVLWSLLFIVLGTTAVIWTMDGVKRTSHRSMRTHRNRIYED